MRAVLDVDVLVVPPHDLDSQTPCPHRRVRIAAVEGKNVVVARLGVDLPDGVAEIVPVDHGQTARQLRQHPQAVLGIEDEARIFRPRDVHIDRHPSNQATRIERVERGVGPVGHPCQLGQLRGQFSGGELLSLCPEHFERVCRRVGDSSIGVAAEATGITPVLVLNKIDLLPDDGGELKALLDRYEALGYPVVEATTQRQDGLDALHARLTERTSVFVGQSGVGKSSLIDRLLPDEALRIGALSEDSRKGTHTTTTARLYRLPSPVADDGGELIDSPGIREFGLGHLSEDEVTQGFIEFRDHLGHCRFRDCRHRQEPGCALLAAVERGDIEAARFDSYRRILASLST